MRRKSNRYASEKIKYHSRPIKLNKQLCTQTHEHYALSLRYVYSEHILTTYNMDGTDAARYRCSK